MLIVIFILFHVSAHFGVFISDYKFILHIENKLVPDWQKCNIHYTQWKTKKMKLRNNNSQSYQLKKLYCILNLYCSSEYDIVYMQHDVSFKKNWFFSLKQLQHFETK